MQRGQLRHLHHQHLHLHGLQHWLLAGEQHVHGGEWKGGFSGLLVVRAWWCTAVVPFALTLTCCLSMLLAVRCHPAQLRHHVCQHVQRLRHVRRRLLAGCQWELHPVQRGQLRHLHHQHLHLHGLQHRLLAGKQHVHGGE